MKFSVIGTGAIASEVIPALLSLGHEVAGLCGTPRSAAKVQEWCETFHIPCGTTDITALLEQVKADAVYISVPNHLHYDVAMQVLAAGQHVILEKPLTSNYREAAALAAFAREKGLFLFEAITTPYLDNYRKIQRWLPSIGTVKVVSCNFSQYSHRYDAFRRGEILPVFDPAKSGGALMDLNLYNLYWLIGLFGAPKTIQYRANVERGIDTSGTLLLDFEGFTAVSIAAKDCGAPCSYVIQGTDGYIFQTTPANGCLDVHLRLNNGTAEDYALPVTPENYVTRLLPEFRFFAQEIASGDTAACYAALDRSLLVSRLMTEARLGAGVRFPADEA